MVRLRDFNVFGMFRCMDVGFYYGLLCLMMGIREFLVLRKFRFGVGGV